MKYQNETSETASETSQAGHLIHLAKSRAKSKRQELQSVGAPEAPEAETAPPRPPLTIPQGPIFKDIPPDKPIRNNRVVPFEPFDSNRAEKSTRRGLTKFETPDVYKRGAEAKIKEQIRILKEFIGTEKLAIVDISATDCPPCKKLKPIFHELADKGLSHGSDRAGFAIFNQNSLRDADDSPALKQFIEKYGVTSYPTLLVFRKGKLIIRAAGGAVNQAVLERKILDLLAASRKRPNRVADFPATQP